MKVACQTCQQGCIGKHLCPCDASDFHSSFGLSPGFSHIMAQMFAPRSERLSRTTKGPCVGIREFSEFNIMLWSFTKCSLVDPFFGTVNMGCITIPGSNSGPKEKTASTDQVRSCYCIGTSRRPMILHQALVALAAT